MEDANTFGQLNNRCTMSNKKSGNELLSLTYDRISSNGNNVAMKMEWAHWTVTQETGL